TPGTSPRYSLSGSFRKFGTESNGISGTASCAPPNCCCAVIAWPAARTSNAANVNVSMRFMVPPLPRRRGRGPRRLLRVQDDLLCAPRGDLGHPQLVLVAAIDAVELHLVDLAGDVARSRRVAVRIGVRRIEVLMRARRDAERPRVAHVVVD